MLCFVCLFVCLPEILVAFMLKLLLQFLHSRCLSPENVIAWLVSEGVCAGVKQ